MNRPLVLGLLACIATAIWTAGLTSYGVIRGFTVGYACRELRGSSLVPALQLAQYDVGRRPMTPFAAATRTPPCPKDCVTYTPRAGSGDGFACVCNSEPLHPDPTEEP